MLANAKLKYILEQKRQKIGKLKSSVIRMEFIVAMLFLLMTPFWYYFIEFGKDWAAYDQEKKMLLFLLVAKLGFDLNRSIRSDPLTEKLDESN